MDLQGAFSDKHIEEYVCNRSVDTRFSSKHFKEKLPIFVFEYLVKGISSCFLIIGCFVKTMGFMVKAHILLSIRTLFMFKWLT